MEQHCVDIRGVSFAHHSRQIFKDLNLIVPTGQVVAIMGPSGIGKTTLLRLIGGQLKPDSGDIFFQGQNIPSLSRQALFAARKQMGMLFQSGALFSGMNVYDNVAFPLREHTQLDESLIRVLVQMKLQAVGLRGAQHLLPSELSGGMARRAALARAIALDPALIMYDEPFVGQDPVTKGVLVKLIRELNDALGLTSILVSHDVPEVMAIADYIYLVSEGQVIAQGTPAALQADTSPRVVQFIQGDPDGPVPFHYPAEPFAKALFNESA